MPDDDGWPECDYTLTQRAYAPRVPGADPEMLDAGTVVRYKGKPGPHMQATDDEGRIAIAMAGNQTLNPHGVVMPGPVDDDEKLAVKIGEAISKAITEGLPALAAAMAAHSAPAAAPVAAKPPPPPPPPPSRAKAA
jgi:hypothetical protein